MTRRDYHLAYYYRTRPRRLALARQHQQARRWCAWLIKELTPEAYRDRWVSWDDMAP